MDEDTDSIPVPIQARSTELNQLHDWIPRVVDKLEQAELDERAAEIRDIYDTNIDITHEAADDPAIVTYVSMPSDQWTTLLGELDRIEDDEGKTRVSYLRRKFYGRLRKRVGEIEE